MILLLNVVFRVEIVLQISNRALQCLVYLIDYDIQIVKAQLIEQMSQMVYVLIAA